MAPEPHLDPGCFASCATSRRIGTLVDSDSWLGFRSWPKPLLAPRWFGGGFGSQCTFWAGDEFTQHYATFCKSFALKLTKSSVEDSKKGTSAWFRVPTWASKRNPARSSTLLQDGCCARQVLSELDMRNSCRRNLKRMLGFTHRLKVLRSRKPTPFLVWRSCLSPWSSWMELGSTGDLRAQFYQDLKSQPNERISTFCTRFRTLCGEMKREGIELPKEELGWFFQGQGREALLLGACVSMWALVTADESQAIIWFGQKETRRQNPAALCSGFGKVAEAWGQTLCLGEPNSVEGLDFAGDGTSSIGFRELWSPVWPMSSWTLWRPGQPSQEANQILHFLSGFFTGIRWTSLPERPYAPSCFGRKPNHLCGWNSSGWFGQSTCQRYWGAVCQRVQNTSRSSDDRWWASTWTAWSHQSWSLGDGGAACSCGGSTRDICWSQVGSEEAAWCDWAPWQQKACQSTGFSWSPSWSCRCCRSPQMWLVRWAAPSKVKRPASLPTPRDTGDQVHLDLVEVFDVHGRKYYVVHVVDWHWATRFQMARLLPNRSSEEVICFCVRCGGRFLDRPESWLLIKPENWWAMTVKVSAVKMKFFYGTQPCKLRGKMVPASEEEVFWSVW